MDPKSIKRWSLALVVALLMGCASQPKPETERRAIELDMPAVRYQ